MTAPALHRCTCGRLRQEHIYRPPTTTRPARWGGTDNGLCAGYVEVAQETPPSVEVLRGRLEAVQHTAGQLLICSQPSHPTDCHCHLPDFVARGLADLVRAARGEAP